MVEDRAKKESEALAAGPDKKNRDPHGIVGSTLAGRYHVSDVVGVGGMGVVYRAHQSTVGRDVAIKALMPEMAGDETLIKRFELEARAASRLNHPNTITVYDFGRDGDLLYIVMEFLEGQSLEQLIRSEGALDPERAARILIQVCGSLNEAHNKGIVHRDIKPDNIFLQTIESQSDFVKVLDFGVAKLRDPALQDTTLTQAGIIFGTPKYMSPEQAKAKKLDGRTDIYSLGVVMFEMLMGAVPFIAGDPVSILIQQVHDPPPSFADTRPDLQVPAELEAIVTKALTKDRGDRYWSAAELRDALEAFLTGATEPAGVPVIAKAQGGGPSPTGPTAGSDTPSQQRPADQPATTTDSSGRKNRKNRPSDPLGIGVTLRDETWGVDGNRLDLGNSPATQMVAVSSESTSSTRLRLVLLAMLLLLAVGAALIYGIIDNDNGRTGPLPDADIEEADQGPATEDGEQADLDDGDDTQQGNGALDGTGGGTGDGTDDDTGDGTGDGTDDGTGDGTDDGTGTGTDDDTGDGTDDGTGTGTDDVATRTWVRVRIEQRRPRSGMRFDFGDREVRQDDTDEDIYLVDPADGLTFEFRASASGHDSERQRVDLNEVDENGVVEQRVRLDEERPEDPCVDPLTGLVDPYCEP